MQYTYKLAFMAKTSWHDDSFSYWVHGINYLQNLPSGTITDIHVAQTCIST